MKINVRRKLGKVMHGVGLTWVYIVGIILVIDSLLVVYQESTFLYGIKALIAYWSPYNYFRYFAIALFIAPGAGLISYGDKLRQVVVIPDVVESDE